MNNIEYKIISMNKWSYIVEDPTSAYEQKIELRYNPGRSSYVGKKSFSYDHVECYKKISEIDGVLTLEPQKYIVEPNGYINIIFDDGTTEFFHKMVAFTWGDKSGNRWEKGMTIDHVDGDKSNNTPWNLEYVSSNVNLARAANNGYNGKFKMFIDECLLADDPVATLTEAQRDLNN